MLTLKEFTQAVNKIQQHEKDSDTLTEIMLRNSIGIIDYGFDIVALCVKLIMKNMNDKDEWLEWWLYDDVEKKIKYKGREYDVSSVESLYYLITDDFEKLKEIA